MSTALIQAATRALSNTAGALLDIVYPPRCVLCGADGVAPLCFDCLAQAAQPLPPPTCSRCGRPCAALPCSDCLADPPSYLANVAAGAYSGALRDAVHQLKYRDCPSLAEPLGEIMAECARANASLLGGLSFDAVVPVPLHPARRRVRGYNQAERLARVIARELDLPLECKALRKIKNTKTQVGQTAGKRQANIESAFQGIPAFAGGKTFLLIDDVTTTGTTLKRCAGELKQAGACTIYALTLAAD